MKRKIITNDPYYSHLEEFPELLQEAGWFDDRQDLDTRKSFYNTDFFCTPLHKLKKPKTNNPVVLLSTGGFSPLHNGHINMMEVAFETLSQQGVDIVGGYFSPSHDNYVLKKHSKTFCIEERIKSIEFKIHSHPYLMSCLWEAVLNKEAINFTDVIQRLEDYLRKYYHPNVSICYVFGSDNQGFIRAFEKLGMCVCVSRDEKLKPELEKIIDSNQNRLFFIENSIFSDLSSRNIPREKVCTEIKPYCLRMDSQFNNDLVNIFSKYKKYIIQLPKKYDINTKNCISLDVHTLGEYNLELSRIFYLGDRQFKSNQLTSRTHKSMHEQISKIPQGSYKLIDDDIASGFTINFVKSLLQDYNIQIEESISLLSTKVQDSFEDVVDLRDFVFGEEYGGLTIELPNNKITRVPYIFPLIDLNFRAKLKYKDAIEFSKEVIDLNLLILQNKQIHELPENQRELFYYFGYSPTDLAIKLLEKILKNLSKLA